MVVVVRSSVLSKAPSGQKLRLLAPKVLLPEPYNLVMLNLF